MQMVQEKAARCNPSTHKSRKTMCATKWASVGHTHTHTHTHTCTYVKEHNGHLLDTYTHTCTYGKEYNGRPHAKVTPNSPN